MRTNITEPTLGACEALLLQAIVVLACIAFSSAHAGPGYDTISLPEGAGAAPTSLIVGTDGRLYGTFAAGGRRGEGVVYSCNRDGSDYAVLHSFDGIRSGGDGSEPQGVIEGSDGWLYGTTKSGGKPGSRDIAMFTELGAGTVFKLKKDGSAYVVLRRFTGDGGEGIEPWAGLVEGHDGALYGTTFEDGREHQGVFGAGHGTVFKLNKDGSAFKVLHHFGTNQTDGDRPFADLIVASDGLLYGATDGGGTGSGRNGIVFTLHLDGSGYRVLHNFPSQPGDCRMPRHRLLKGQGGELYGSTQHGGNGDNGTLFSLDKTENNYKILHSFTGFGASRPDPQGVAESTLNGIQTKIIYDGDGHGPQTIIQAQDGTLYGTTKTAGKNGRGTLFKIKPDGNGFTTLHSFPSFEGDACHPQGSLVISNDRVLYGIAMESSTNGTPKLFKMSLPSDRADSNKSSK